MAATGSLVFSVLLWGALAGVFLVFVYELVVISREAGWTDLALR